MEELEDALFWIGMAAFAAIAAWQLFHVLRTEEVGRVQATGEPFGWRGEGATIAVRRRRGFRRHPRIVLMLHQDGLRVLALSAPEARKLAAQPGIDLDAARQAWRREQERAGARGAS